MLWKILFTISLLCYFQTFILADENDADNCGLINTDQFNDEQKFTQIDEYPWIGRIAYKNTEPDRRFKCVAVLISQRHLLTMAHCLNDGRTDIEEPYAVLLGDWKASLDDNYLETDCNDNNECSTPQLIEIDEMITYPFYNTGKPVHNIAIIRLVKTVTITSYIRPICLPASNNTAKEFGSERMTITGWILRVAGRKEKSTAFVYNQHDCQKKYADVRQNISDFNVCAMDCDYTLRYMSGSALMDVKTYEENEPKSMYLFGILIMGPRTRSRIYPNIYLRIDRYLEWIKQNMY